MLAEHPAGRATKPRAQEVGYAGGVVGKPLHLVNGFRILCGLWETVQSLYPVMARPRMMPSWEGRHDTCVQEMGSRGVLRVDRTTETPLGVGIVIS